MKESLMPVKQNVINVSAEIINSTQTGPSTHRELRNYICKEKYRKRWRGGGRGISKKLKQVQRFHVSLSMYTDP